MSNMNYYTAYRLLQKGAPISIAIGSRSAGKSTSFLRICLERYLKSGSPCAIIRVLGEDIKATQAATFWDGVVGLGWVFELTGGEWSQVHYWRGAYYLARRNEKGDLEKDTEPFSYVFAVSTWEKYKGTAFKRGFSSIFHDEFILTRPITDQGHRTEQLLSTLIRHKGADTDPLADGGIGSADGLKIFYAGNTITYSAPMLEYYGIAPQVRSLQPGQIGVFSASKTTEIAVEFTGTGGDSKGKKPSDVFFNIDNTGRANMITHAVWSLPDFPKITESTTFTSRDVKRVGWVILPEDDEIVLRMRVIRVGKGLPFVFVEKRSAEVYHSLVTPRDAVFSLNFKGDTIDPYNAEGRGRVFSTYLHKEAVLFADNESGELFRGYCDKAATFGIRSL